MLLYSELFIHFLDRTKNFLALSLALTFFGILLLMASRFNSETLPLYSVVTNSLGPATYSFYLMHQQIGLFLATVLHGIFNLSLFLAGLVSLVSILFMSVFLENLNKMIWRKLG
jgi:peptidoglycan/LPS O-acetylase OafA/YrhL